MSQAIQLGSDINRYNRALELNQRIEKRNKAFVLDTLIDLREMYDTDLYKELGHKSMNDYIIHTMNIAKGQASKYVTILSDVIPLALTDKVSQRETFLKDSERGVSGEHLSDLPLDYEKLYALSKLKKKQLHQLFEQGFVRLRGRAYTMQELNDLPRLKVVELITEARSSGLPKEVKPVVWDDAARNKIADLMDKWEQTLKHYKDVMPPQMMAELRPLIKPLQVWYENYLRKLR